MSDPTPEAVRAALAHPTSSPKPTGGYWDGGGKHHPAASQPVLQEVLDVLDRHMFVSRAKAGAPDRCSDCHPDQPWPCDAVRMARLILVLQQPGGTTMTETPELREALAWMATERGEVHMTFDRFVDALIESGVALAPTSSPEEKR